MLAGGPAVVLTATSKHFILATVLRGASITGVTMSAQRTYDHLDQLQQGTISRRTLATRAAAVGMSAPAAGILLHHASAQDASPEASPATSTLASPVAGEVTRSMTREEYYEALRQAFPFEEPQSTGGQVIVVETTDISTLNPVLVVDVYSGLLSGFIYEGLVGTSAIDGTSVPALADYWEVGADGITYTFHLNRKATWHDGRPVTADDVIFTIDSVIDETSLSPRRTTVLNVLESYRKIDDHTVELVAVDRLATFVSETVGQFGIVPKHIWESIPFAEWGSAPGSTGQDPTQVIGSGPFKFVEWVLDDHVTVTRNDQYWDTEHTPVIDDFVFRVVADTTSALQSVVTGESDITGVDPTQAATLRESNPELTIEEYDTFGFTYYEFNLDPAKALPFTDVKVRQALMYALDRDLMVNTIYQGLATRADGTQPTLSIAYAPDRINTIYTYQPEKAEQLLTEAGWVDSDGDGIRDKDGARFSFEFFYSEGRRCSNNSFRTSSRLGERLESR
jgi:peptide/nickel transport system substrate-binding protein